MQLVRSMTPPNVVHQPQCKRRGTRCEPWHYATTKTLDQISADTRQIPWLHLCKSCLPGACHCEGCTP